jgi:hypothetical protein
LFFLLLSFFSISCVVFVSSQTGQEWTGQDRTAAARRDETREDFGFSFFARQSLVLRVFLLVANLAFLRHFSGLGERRGGRERGEKDQVHGRIQEKRTNVFWEGVRFGRRDISTWILLGLEKCSESEAINGG